MRISYTEHIIGGKDCVCEACIGDAEPSEVALRIFWTIKKLQELSRYKKVEPKICPCGIDSRDCDYHR